MIRNRRGGSSASPPIFIVGELVAKLQGKDGGLQSAGVYWIPLSDILEECGFEVYLVTARQAKNLT